MRFRKLYVLIHLIRISIHHCLRTNMQQMLQKGTVLDSGGSQASFLMQAFTLTKRSFVNMSRDFGYYWLRLLIYIVVTICIGTIYLNVGTGYTSILVDTLVTSLHQSTFISCKQLSMINQFLGINSFHSSTNKTVHVVHLLQKSTLYHTFIEKNQGKKKEALQFSFQRKKKSIICIISNFFLLLYNRLGAHVLHLSLALSHLCQLEGFHHLWKI